MGRILVNKLQAPVGRNVSRWWFYNFDAPHPTYEAQAISALLHVDGQATPGSPNTD